MVFLLLECGSECGVFSRHAACYPRMTVDAAMHQMRHVEVAAGLLAASARSETQLVGHLPRGKHVRCQMKRDIACKHNQPPKRLQSLTLRKENFRWADLVSGNLKEEKNAHSTQLLHSSGPHLQPRNVLFRYAHSRYPACRVWGLSCTFGGQQAQSGSLSGNGSHNGPRGFVNWRKIRITLKTPQ